MYVHTYIHAYMHTFIHAYIHTCIHAQVYRKSTDPKGLQKLADDMYNTYVKEVHFICYTHLITNNFLFLSFYSAILSRLSSEGNSYFSVYFTSLI